MINTDINLFLWTRLCIKLYLFSCLIPNNLKRYVPKLSSVFFRWEKWGSARLFFALGPILNMWSRFSSYSNSNLNIHKIFLLKDNLLMLWEGSNWQYGKKEGRVEGCKEERGGQRERNKGMEEGGKGEFWCYESRNTSQLWSHLRPAFSSKG